MQRINPKKHNLDFTFEDSLPLDHEGSELLSYAKTGDLQAIRNLGCAFIWGENGFPKDESRARIWYLIAANHGHYEAMWDVATMLLSGEGGPKDIEYGIQLLSRVSHRKRFTVYGISASEFLIDIYKGTALKGIDRDENQMKYWEERLKAHKRYLRGWNRKCR